MIPRMLLCLEPQLACSRFKYNLFAGFIYTVILHTSETDTHLLRGRTRRRESLLRVCISLWSTRSLQFHSVAPTLTLTRVNPSHLLLQLLHLYFLHKQITFSSLFTPWLLLFLYHNCCGHSHGFIFTRRVTCQRTMNERVLLQYTRGFSSSTLFFSRHCVVVPRSELCK